MGRFLRRNDARRRSVNARRVMPIVTLIDGRQVDSASEDWRHECEARYVAELPGLEARRAYLEKVTTKRGAAAGEQLKALVTTIFTANRTGSTA